jgi:hypothetical protein
MIDEVTEVLNEENTEEEHVDTAKKKKVFI